MDSVNFVDSDRADGEKKYQTDQSMDSVNFGMDWRNEVYAKGGTLYL